MGSSNSIKDKMPKYYVKAPKFSQTKCDLLELSLKNIIHGVCSLDDDTFDNQRLPFLNFYETFFRRLSELEEEEEFSLRAHFDFDLEQQSIFLIRLLKFCVDVPKNELQTKEGNKWLREDRKHLKTFIYEYEGLDINCFGGLGKALFYAVEKCDEMCTQAIHNSWVEAYSVLLDQIIPIAARLRRKRRKKTDLLRRALSGGVTNFDSASETSGSSDADSDLDSQRSLSPSQSPPRSPLLRFRRLRPKNVLRTHSKSLTVNTLFPPGSPHDSPHDTPSPSPSPSRSPSSSYSSASSTFSSLSLSIPASPQPINRTFRRLRNSLTMGSLPLIDVPELEGDPRSSNISRRSAQAAPAGDGEDAKIQRRVDTPRSAQEIIDLGFTGTKRSESTCDECTPVESSSKLLRRILHSIQPGQMERRSFTFEEKKEQGDGTPPLHHNKNDT